MIGARPGVATPETQILNGEISLWAWQSPGPVATAFLQSTDDIALIMGPQGSGKTVTSVVKSAFQTLRIPVCRDGVLRARGAVIRDNFRTLYRTTLPTWFRVFPRDFPGSDFEGGQDRPAKHTIRFRTPVGQLVEMMVDFFAVGDHSIQELLRGYEPTWVWGNEPDLLADNVLRYSYSRTGRYPPRMELRDENAPMPRHVWGDINPPSVDHFIYKHFVEERREGWKLYQQPSGLDDAAENRRGKPREAYEGDARNLSKADVVRFVHGRFGYSTDGNPVYADFDHQKVFAQDELEVLPGIPLCAGLDQGLSPALVLFQSAPSGQIRFLAEIVPPHGTGPARFCEMIVALLTSPRFRNLAMGAWFSDPAGFYGVDRIAGEISWTETVSRAIGVPILPAPSQDLGLRIDALRIPLMTDLSPERKFVILDPSCRMLREGLAAQYKFAKQKQAGREVLADRPLKNEWSHPVEAAQYGVLGIRGRAGVINEAARAGRAGDVVPRHSGRSAGADFNVWSV